MARNFCTGVRRTIPKQCRMIVDLHTHTTASDGTLSPQALIDAASAAGVTLLSITDHDAADAYRNLTVPAELTLIPGVEFSTAHAHTGIHVLGLKVALEHRAMRDALFGQRMARQQRAQRIAEKLAHRGYADAYAGAARHAGDGVIGRPHFAAWLVEIRAASSVDQAFRKFLGRDGGYIDGWASMPDLVAAIREAGGIAVLAHPAKYKLTRARLDRLVTAFVDAGGSALEVISGLQRPDITRDLAALATRHGLAASLGSDFHQPGQSWAALGRLSPLPPECVPVWANW